MLDGQNIYKLGEGNQEPQKWAGDLIFRIKYLEDDVFQYRPIRNIVFKATIPLHQAVRHVDITVRTPNIGSNLHLTKFLKGQVIRTGQEMQITNEGLPDYFDADDSKKRGKLIINFLVEWPKDLTSEQVQKIKALFNMRCAVDPSDNMMAVPLHQLSPEEEQQNKNELFPVTYWIEPKNSSKLGVLKKIQTVWKWFTWSKTVLSKTAPIARSIRDVSDATWHIPISNVEETCQSTHLNPVFSPIVEDVSKVTTNRPTEDERWYCPLKLTKSNVWEESEHYYLNRTDDDKSHEDGTGKKTVNGNWCQEDPNWAADFT